MPENAEATRESDCPGAGGARCQHSPYIESQKRRRQHPAREAINVVVSRDGDGNDGERAVEQLLPLLDKFLVSLRRYRRLKVAAMRSKSSGNGVEAWLELAKIS